MENLLPQSTSEPVMWAITRRGHARYARAALVGGVLPVVLALVNQRLVARMVAGYEAPATALACAAVLAEIAMVGVLCAKFIEPGRARWLAYVWMWVILDFTVAPRIVDGIWWGHPMALLAPALLSVQLVLVGLWAVFGSTRWSIRWPAAAAIMVLGAGVPLAAHAYGARRIAWLVASQTVAFLVACLVLHWRGNRTRAIGSGSRLLGVESFGDDRDVGLATDAGRTQFFMRDLLVWTTLAAMLLALARAFELFLPPGMWILREHGVALMCLTGALSALLHLAALSVMLGQRWAVVRWGRLAAGGVFAVVSLGVYHYYSFAVRGLWPVNGWHPLLRRQYWEFFLTAKWHLLAWMGLSVAMLIASLVFLRVQGFRLGCEGKDSRSLLERTSGASASDAGRSRA